MDRKKTRRKKAIDRGKEKDMRRYKLHMDNEKAYLEHIERERGREREREKILLCLYQIRIYYDEKCYYSSSIV